jgi:hypothetical protein
MPLRMNLTEATDIATALRRSAVAIAVCTSIPSAIKTGIRMKAAPTPAMVSKVVKMKVIIPAIIVIYRDLLYVP